MIYISNLYFFIFLSLILIFSYSSEMKTSEEVISLPSNWLLKKTENYALVEVGLSYLDASFEKPNPYSAETVFICQNLTSVDDRF